VSLRKQTMPETAKRALQRALLIQMEMEQEEGLWGASRKQGANVQGRGRRRTVSWNQQGVDDGKGVVWKVRVSARLVGGGVQAEEEEEESLIKDLKREANSLSRAGGHVLYSSVKNTVATRHECSTSRMLYVNRPYMAHASSIHGSCIIHTWLMHHSYIAHHDVTLIKN
jgi:hypothetical protein